MEYSDPSTEEFCLKHFKIWEGSNLRISQAKTLAAALCSLGLLVCVASPAAAEGSGEAAGSASAKVEKDTLASSEHCVNTTPASPVSTDTVDTVKAPDRRTYHEHLMVNVVGWMEQHLDRYHTGVHFHDISLVLLPQRAQIFVGAHGNKAIYLNRKTRETLMSAWREKLTRYAVENSGEWVQNPEVISVQKAVLFLESKSYPLTGKGLLNDLGVIAHEYGHAYNDKIGRSNTEGNAYLFELWALREAIGEVTYLPCRGVTTSDVLSYLNGRIADYKKSSLEDRKKIWEKLVQIESALHAMPDASTAEITIRSAFANLRTALFNATENIDALYEELAVLHAHGHQEP